MASFAARCGVADAVRAARSDEVLQTIRENGIEQVRIGWCDLHGVLRGKTLVASALAGAFANGVGMVMLRQPPLAQLAAFRLLRSVFCQ